MLSPTTVPFGFPSRMREMPNADASNRASHSPLSNGPAALPFLQPDEAKAALAVLAASERILRRTGAVLACLHVCGNEGMICLWDRSWQPDPAASRCLGDPASPSAGDMTELAEALVDLEPLLLRRWPPFGRPSLLGLVTDGSGLGFSPDDPAPMQPGWLARQVEGHASFTALIPFSPTGPWQQLVAGLPKGAVQ